MVFGCRIRKIILSVIVLSFLTAGISPACRFISGQSSFIEICTVFGIQKIAVSDADSLISESDPDSEHKIASLCLFCVTSHISHGVVDDYERTGWALYDDQSVFLVSNRHQPDYVLSQLLLEARAPPYIS